MEEVHVVEAFLRIINTGYGYGDGSGDGYGYGSGSGYGYGSGSGYGDGYGYGSGSGYGYGSGDGYGSGSGSGDGLKTYNGERVWYIDEIPTLVDSVKGDYARGRIVKDNLTTKDCYIARVGNYWAHGTTLHEAQRDAEAKALAGMPVEERIRLFQESHPDLDTPYGDLFEWHHILTGSCKMGREAWCEAHGYNPTDSITIRTFITQTLHDYGGKVIAQLAEAYNLNIS